MPVFILDFFVKTVAWILQQKWQNYLILPLFFNEKEYCSCEIAAMQAGSGHVQVGMATKIFVLILHVTGDQC